MLKACLNNILLIRSWTQKGYLWAFPSSNDLFIVEQGESTLKEYEFNKRTMAHKVSIRNIYKFSIDHNYSSVPNVAHL